VDLLFHLPERITDRRRIIPLATLEKTGQPGDVVTLRATVQQVTPPRSARQPLRIRVTDHSGNESGSADLVFFGPHHARRLRPGDEIAFSGPLDRYNDRLTFQTPDYLVPATRQDQIPTLDPVWGLTAGLFPSTLRSAMAAALALLPPLPEWLDPTLVQRRRWPDFATALRALHAPSTLPSLHDNDAWPAAIERARSRLACDEILADQLCLGMARLKARNKTGRAMPGTGHLRAEALARFGHTPTGAQTRAITDIDADMARPRQMMRLLQGDVGAGKTLVAAMAMLRAVESGAQAALMAPTEILARQHLETLTRLCPVPIAFLSGSITGKPRRETLARLADGTARIAVGTHALFQDKVAFQDLGLAVIDEQHRFGVEQRMRLGNKGGPEGSQADILVMTATPIPRTLQLTQYGEMQVSRLDEKPPGRMKIATSLHSTAALADVIAGITRAIDRGVQVFWVCPLVEESEKSDSAAAEERWAALHALFGNRVGLAHGRQDITTRQAALDAFQQGQTRILVATTVIEVGVDVPNASVMVIEHAESFGLAQLHQLRGRVGRGSLQSYCLLLFDEAASQTARRRLALLRETEDGFLIADEDFRTRGGGDLAGRRQSGIPGFRLAQGARLDLLITTGAQDSEMILKQDPALLQPRGQALKLALRLFDRDNPDRILIAG